MWERDYGPLDSLPPGGGVNFLIKPSISPSITSKELDITSRVQVSKSQFPNGVTSEIMDSLKHGIPDSILGKFHIANFTAQAYCKVCEETTGGYYKFLPFAGISGVTTSNDWGMNDYKITGENEDYFFIEIKPHIIYLEPVSTPKQIDTIYYYDERDMGILVPKEIGSSSFSQP
jgi:hypothetical protein